MPGYHESSTLERAITRTTSALATVARAVAEALLLAFVAAWSAFWLRVGWATYVQGHLVDLALVVAFSVVPIAGWYAWRTLGYLPVERPAFDERLPTSASA